jgi:hypothetical protein
MKFNYRNNKDRFDQLIIGDNGSIDNSNWIPGAPVKLLIHGWGGNYDHTFPWNLRGGMGKKI